jgi:hypothetical protein
MADSISNHDPTNCSLVESLHFSTILEEEALQFQAEFFDRVNALRQRITAHLIH